MSLPINDDELQFVRASIARAERAENANQGTPLDHAITCSRHMRAVLARLELAEQQRDQVFADFERLVATVTSGRAADRGPDASGTVRP